jgi:hypothetical protein
LFADIVSSISPESNTAHRRRQRAERLIHAWYCGVFKEGLIPA